MTGKRSRGIYEANLQAQQSPFVFYGTPLPPQDPDIRDDGSYVPIWKQEVRDERGLKRLHGAFTGGFSAGYFNTVGSKEGWTPSTFTSSRLNRNNDASKINQKRPEDFMDEEDIRDAEDARRVETLSGFSGLGTTANDTIRSAALIDLFRIEGETIGSKLLQKMGWKEGQGIGPRVRRAALLGDDTKSEKGSEYIHYFAPKNTAIVRLLKKNDYKGLGYQGEAKLGKRNNFKLGQIQPSDDDDDDPKSLSTKYPIKKKSSSSGFGVGILNDTGSDDEDPYDIGPRISYNRFIGADKKKESKKKKANRAINPLVGTKPVYLSKKAIIKPQKLSDGYIDGFVLSTEDELSSSLLFIKKYQPPPIPEGWKSSKQTNLPVAATTYNSVSDVAKTSRLDPKTRASILGELALPGKSVFDYLSPAARERVATASGKSDLPPALGEVPKEFSMTEGERQKQLLSRIPIIDKSTADAALSRGTSGFMPYGDDAAKRNRYRAYLEYQSGISNIPPFMDSSFSEKDWLQELNEFANCAQIFKPISGSMATRFTSSVTTSPLSGDVSKTSKSLLTKFTPKPDDYAENAAKLSMYGTLTRSYKDWYPSRLLCKRFNINPPSHVTSVSSEQNDKDLSWNNTATELVSKVSLNAIMRDSNSFQNGSPKPSNQIGVSEIEEDKYREEVVVDAGKNEALEGKRAGEAVFRAIFGDDSSDDE
ncbi:G patch domain-containing protein 1 [Erysiphe neolycopersici]|uniref:G patch domain-containing protein 1 n=1 Tax=Erysiphe neolycopersici TaxID=212602 RepID=A0A420HQA9_9PEZI|nr:G patch domain-containing protein 1 [Erysiphe neolycopersici]